VTDVTGVLRLTDLLGATVIANGAEVGRVFDLGVGLESSHPPVEMVEVRVRRGERSRYAIGELARFEPGLVNLGDAEPARGSLGQQLMLRAHVLDAQVVDLVGKRMVRVGDVVLGSEERAPRLVGIEFGPQPLFRRLGLRRLALRRRSQTIDWADVHLASAPGHELHCTMPRARVHSLEPEELAALIAHLPAPRAAEVIRATGAPPEAEPEARIPRHRRRGRRFGRVMRARRHAPS
jgi:hypothetical protein